MCMCLLTHTHIITSSSSVSLWNLNTQLNVSYSLESPKICLRPTNSTTRYLECKTKKSHQKYSQLTAQPYTHIKFKSLKLKHNTCLL